MKTTTANAVFCLSMSIALILFSLDVNAQTAGSSDKTPMPTELCPLNNHDDLFLLCPGKRVTIGGRRAADADSTRYPDISGVGGYTHSATMQNALGEVGVIARKPIKCRKAITVDGVLRVNRSTRANGIVTLIPYVQASDVRCK